ncbi:MAG: phosphatase PAP2 family protein [Bacteriovorax sp.]|nr:phosphatase PAP2 family protein [Bacteriovorax sp.]
MPTIISKIEELDRFVILSVAKCRKNELTFVLKLFTYSARGYAWIVYAIVLNVLSINEIQFIERPLSILKAMLCTFMTWVIGRLIKKKFHRKRPFQAIPNFPALVHSPIDDSFPSLHAASTTAFLIALLFLHHPWAPWVGLWAVIVIFSRLYLGVHYLSDLLGGIILGLFCGFLISI